jgi:phosphatidylglycerophosphate synthase
VWGLSADERLRRALERAGVSRIDVLGADEKPEAQPEPCVVLWDDLFYDERVLAGLIEADGVIVLHRLGLSGDDASAARSPVAAACSGPELAEVVAAMRSPRPEAPPGIQPVSLLDLAPAYDKALRKSQEPFVYAARESDLREVENRIFAASYKGITDVVTKWVFPVPAREVVRVLARRGIQPNTVTAVSYLLAGLVTWLFWEGWFATGLVLGWLMSFLDTVDGKLARCTLTSTRFGNAFDHGLDMVHPPFWWAAWAAGLAGGFSEHTLALAVIVGGYVVGRLLEGAFIVAFGIQFFMWRPFDGYFRQVIARRNPNMILLSLGVLVGSPEGGFHAVAWWTVACIVIAAVRNVQGHLAAMRGEPVTSWLDEASLSG